MRDLSTLCFHHVYQFGLVASADRQTAVSISGAACTASSACAKDSPFGPPTSHLLARCLGQVLSSLRFAPELGGYSVDPVTQGTAIRVWPHRLAYAVEVGVLRTATLG